MSVKYTIIVYTQAYFGYKLMDTYMCIAKGTYILYCPDVLFECYDMFVQDLAVLDDNIC